MRMLRFSFVLAVAASVSSSISATTGNAQSVVQAVSVSFPGAESAKVLDGRLLVLLSNDPTEEPRMQIDDTPRSQMVFGMTVDGWKPGQSVKVDDSAAGYPVRKLSEVPAGDYTVQAVLGVYQTFHRADGETIKLSPGRGEGEDWKLAPGELLRKP